MIYVNNSHSLVVKEIRSLIASLLSLCEPCYSSFSSSRSSKRAITDQIFPGIAFFLVLESTCGMLHACMHEL